MFERFAGRYLLLRRLGHGGMGDVYLARDTTTGVECALKRLSPAIAEVEPDAIRREFKALKQVRHPALISVYELGVAPDGTPFCTMEFVPGVTSDRAIPRADWDVLLYVAARVSEGLEALHDANVIHGDLKPSNLLVVPPSNGSTPSDVRLVDFGLSVLGNQPGEGNRGTPGYAAPEVVRGEAPTRSSDLYGLGATLYALCAKRPPFEGPDIDSVLSRQIEGPPSSIPLTAAGTPSELVQLIMRLMAHDPRERLRDAREFRLEIERLSPAARRPLEERLRAAIIAGREQELAVIETWAAQRPVVRPMLVLEAQAGGGKTALLGEIATRAALDERVAIHLSATEVLGSGAVAAALLRRFAAEANADPTDDALEPSVRELLADSRTTVQEEDLDGFVTVASRWAVAMRRDSGPAVVMIDDVESLDAVSAAFVRRMVVAPAATPVLWLLARRPPSESGDEANVLIDAGVAQHLPLDPLQPESLDRLISARLGSPAPSRLITFLYARSGGHPGQCVELLFAATKSGAVQEQEGRILVDVDRLGALPPAGFEQARIARVGSLSEEARTVATALAVWALPVSDATLVRLITDSVDAGDSNEARWREMLDELLRGGVAARDREGRVALSPPSLGAQIGGNDQLRRRLHLAALNQPALTDVQRFRHLQGSGEVESALDVAETLFGRIPDERLAMEAELVAADLSPSRAGEWAERAARLLFRRGRYAEGVPFLQRALVRPVETARERGDRWALLGTAYLRSGECKALERLVAAAEKEDIDDGSRGRVLCNEAARLIQQGDLRGSRHLAERALNLAKSASDSDGVGLALEALAHESMTSGRLDEAESHVEQLEVALATQQSPRDRVRPLVLRASLERLRGNLVRSALLYEQSLEAARLEGYRILLEEALLNASVVLVELGRWTQAREHLLEARRIALEDGRPQGTAVATASLAQIEGLLGFSKSAVRQGKAAIRMAHRKVTWVEPLGWRSLAQGERISGRLHRARYAADRAIRSAMRSNRADLDWCYVERCRIEASLGRWAAVGELVQQGLAIHGHETVGTNLLRLQSGGAALRSGNIDAARECIEKVERWLKDHDMPYAKALALGLKAETAYSQGKDREGTELGVRAMRALSELPAPPDQACLALDLARGASRGGSANEKAIEWLTQASEIFERLGDRRNRELALSLAVERLREKANAPSASGGLDLLERVSGLLRSLSDLKQLAERAMQMAVEQLGAKRGVLLLVDPETKEPTILAEIGAVDTATRERALGYSRSVVKKVSESGRGLRATDALSEPGLDSPSVLGLDMRSILCVPLFVAGEVVGVVYLSESRSHAFSDSDRRLLEGFAHLMAVAIDKSQSQEEVQRTNERLVGENLSLRQAVGSRFKAKNVVGSSAPMRKVMAVVEQIAHSNSRVLLTGENGTGKELIALTIHAASKRRMKPFVTINCGALTESLLESELFGVRAKVATEVGARDGRFVEASGGTLFLDEIGEMPLKQQVALLTVLSNHEVTPVGGGRPISIDVRVIAATNKNLGELIERKEFREDLYYRLGVIEIEVPSLRERKADIPALVDHFVRVYAEEQGREPPKLSDDFLPTLMQSDWPGNVRGLQNYVERVMAMTPGRILRPNPGPRDLEVRGIGPRPVRKGGLKDAVEELERGMIQEALDNSGGNQTKAARALGITEQALRFRLEKFGFARPRKNLRIR